ncbi:MAG: AraC family transcriptional regulator, partial [Alphaproteobacteria bacterium]
MKDGGIFDDKSADPMRMSSTMSATIDRKRSENSQHGVALSDPVLPADSPEPQLWTEALAGVDVLLHEREISFSRILEAARIAPDSLQAGRGLIPVRTFMDIMNRASQAAQDPDFGLHVGERYSPPRRHAYYYVLSNAACLREGLESAAKYLRLVAHLDCALTISEEGTGFFLVSPPRGSPASAHFNCCSMARWQRRICEFLGPEWKPAAVSFLHEEPDDISEYVRIFGPDIRFSQPDNGLHLTRADLDTPLPDADPALFSVLQDYCDRLLHQQSGPSCPVQAARQYITRNAAAGQIEIERVAEALGLGVGTLKKALAENGLTYRDLLDSTRKDLARVYLGDPELPFSE